MKDDRSARVRRAMRAVCLCGAALALAGCYTALQHPRTPEVASAEISGSCLRCHEQDGSLDAASVNWVSYYAYSSYPWLNYYASPWWYDSYWQHSGDCGTCEDDSPAAQKLRGRQGWGRRPRDGASLGDGVERATSALSPLAPSAPAVAAPAAGAASTGDPAAPAEKPPESQAPEEEKKERPGRAVRR